MLQSLVFGALPVGVAAVTAAAGLPDLAGVLRAALTAGGVIGTFGPVTAAGKRHYVRLSSRFAAALLPVAALSVRLSAGFLIAIGAALAGGGLRMEIPRPASSSSQRSRPGVRPRGAVLRGVRRAAGQDDRLNRHQSSVAVQAGSLSQPAGEGVSRRAGRAH